MILGQSNNKPRNISTTIAQDEPGEPTAQQFEVYQFVISGHSSVTASRKFGISKVTVSKIIREVNRYLFRLNLAEIKLLKSEHTERLYSIYEQAMSEWRRSQQNAEVETTTVSPDGEVTVANKISGSIGNAGLLQTALDALAQIREIWGANAPISVQHSHDVRVAGLSADDARETMAGRLIDAAAKIRAPHTTEDDGETGDE